jgi:hypothetical protein
MKLLTKSGLAGTLSVTVGFVGRWTTPGVDEQPGVRDLDVPRRAFAVAPAQNAASEDRFVKSKRSLDVGDGEKVCDGKPVLRRHLIDFLFDLYLAGGRLQFGHCTSPFSRIDHKKSRGSAFARRAV